MNSRHAFLAALLYGAATAASATADAHRALDWHCAREGAPTWAEVGQVYGHADNYRTYHAGIALNLFVKRACKAGATMITVAATASDGLELAAR